MGKRTIFHTPTVHPLEIPTELLYREPVITMLGQHTVFVENYKCILSYDCTEICLKTSNGKLKICGKNLWIPFYTSEEMKIEGQITGILLEGR